MSYWKVGHIIQNGKYVIDKVLGAGGAGVTYRAKDTKTENLVAIKTLNAMIQAQPDFSKHQERFVQEAFRLAKSSHPHVIRVDDVCKEGELWCMIMEYINGGNLEFLVKKKGGFSEAEGLRYISQVGSALDYIHHQGILHRDVKPANIMRRKETNEAVLIDFGLARDFIEDKTQVHTNSRTEGFAPIEQYMRSAKRGAYTDVYALAGTLYYLLTVQIPFPAQFRNQGINLVSPQQHNPEISDRVNYAILKGMELQPENRPQSVAEWLSLLLGETEIPPSPPTVAHVRVTPPVANGGPTNPKTSPLPLPPLTTNPNRRRERRNVQPTSTTRSASYDPLSPSRFTQHHIPDPEIETNPSLISTTRSPLESKPVNPQRTSPTEKEELASDVGIDYNPLKDLLAAGKWQEADGETNQLILKITGKEDSRAIDQSAMKNFPCRDLHTIDKLWVKYSKGRFGFSVQKRIYQSLGGRREYNKKAWEAIGDKVGWRANNIWLFQENLTYSLAAPQGHLPSLANSGLLERGIHYLVSRGMDCNL
jgi:serine/threonine protein kinase